MVKVPTDLDILDAIFEKYYKPFTAVPIGSRSAMFPIDISSIAQQLGVDAEIVFGRLYFHLDHKYGHEKVHLFSPVSGDKNDAINFPFLSSIVADLREQERTRNLTTYLSIASLIISLLSFALAA